MGAVSDLAAMGARPLVRWWRCVPESGEEGDLSSWRHGGVAEASRGSGCMVVGGDLSAGGVLTVVVTVLGTLDGGAADRRSAGWPAPDVAFVSGPAADLRRDSAGLPRPRSGAGRPLSPSVEPGEVESALAVAYRRPLARLARGEVARLAGAHAMIDVSDGLALDLHRLADTSGAGFALHTVPVAAGATLEEALGGGEDYETHRGGRSTGRERTTARCAERAPPTGADRDLQTDVSRTTARGRAPRAPGLAARRGLRPTSASGICDFPMVPKPSD